MSFDMIMNQNLFGLKLEAEEKAVWTSPITIVDDDPNMHFVIEKFLRKKIDHQMQFYTESKRLVLKNEFKLERSSLYIIDINLPEITGITLAKHLRANQLSRTPILFISQDEDYYERVYQDFFSEKSVLFLKKPFSKEDLIKNVYQLL